MNEKIHPFMKEWMYEGKNVWKNEFIKERMGKGMNEKWTSGLMILWKN